MTLLETLPEKLRHQLSVMQDPEGFAIQAIEKAILQHDCHKRIRQVRGKYKSIATTSHDFAMRKQQEIDLDCDIVFLR